MFAFEEEYMHGLEKVLFGGSGNIILKDALPKPNAMISKDQGSFELFTIRSY